MVYIQVPAGRSVAVGGETIDGPFSFYAETLTVGGEAMTYGTVLVTAAGPVKVSEFDPVDSAVVVPFGFIILILACILGRVL